MRIQNWCKNNYPYNCIVNIFVYFHTFIFNKIGDMLQYCWNLCFDLHTNHHYFNGSRALMLFNIVYYSLLFFVVFVAVLLLSFVCLLFCWGLFLFFVVVVRYFYVVFLFVWCFFGGGYFFFFAFLGSGGRGSSRVTRPCVSTEHNMHTVEVYISKIRYHTINSRRNKL